MTETEKKQPEQNVENTQQATPEVVSSEKVEKQEEKEVQSNENQKEKKATETQADTEQLLVALDAEVVKDVYSEKTKKEMLALRTDISAGKIDKQAATKKLEDLKKETQSDKKEGSSDDDLTLWQQAKKWALIAFLPLGIGKKLADKIKPEKKNEDKKDEKEKSSVWRSILKRTGILTVGTFIATKARKFFKEKLGGKKENIDVAQSSNNSETPDGQNTGQTSVTENVGDQSVQEQTSETSSEQPTQQATPEQIQQEYQRLQAEQPTFSESLLFAWATALANKQTTFQDNGKTYFCYKNENDDDIVTADSTKYEAHIQQQEQNADNDLPTVQGALSAEQQQQSDNATAEANQMQADGFNELYVLMRMYQRGFLPAKSFAGEGRIFAPLNALFDKQFDFAVYMRKLIPSVRERLTITQTTELANISDPDYYKRVGMLINMEDDIKTGKIKTFEELEKKYGKQMETEIGWRVKRSKKALSKVQKNIEGTINSYEANEKQIVELEKQMKETKDASLKKLQEIDAQAKKTTDPKTKKTLLAELQKYTDEYNAKAIEYQKTTGQIMSTMSEADIMRLETHSPFVKGILKSSGGASKFIEGVNSKGGKIMLGVALWGLATKGASDIGQQGFLSKETALDAADLGAGMVPFAGGVYDITQAIRGKDLNGRELSTKDKWIRGGMGALTLGLDVVGLFTFGAGNGVAAALRAGEKGIVATSKVVKGAEAATEVARATEKAAEAAEFAAKTGRAIEATEDITKVGSKLLPIYKGLKVTSNVAMFGGLGMGLYEGVTDFSVNLVKPVATGATKQVEVVATKPVTI